MRKRMATSKPCMGIMAMVFPKALQNLLVGSLQTRVIGFNVVGVPAKFANCDKSLK